MIIIDRHDKIITVKPLKAVIYKQDILYIVWLPNLHQIVSALDAEFYVQGI